MTVSILLPTRNAEWCLPYTLQTLEKQTKMPDEMVICIGKSDDCTEDVVQKWCFHMKNRLQISVIYDKEGIGTGFAMKRLVEEAKGDYILWISSDMLMPENFVESVLELVKQPLAEQKEDEKGREASRSYSVSHRIEPPLSCPPVKLPLSVDSWFFRLKEVSKDYVPRNYNLSALNLEDVNLGERPTPAVFRRDSLLKIGNFDARFYRGQDADILLRLKRAGCRSVVCNNVTVYHFGFSSAKTLWKKALVAPTFFKFLHKYGFEYLRNNKLFFFASLLRMIFLASLVLTIPIYLIFGQSAVIFSTLVLYASSVGLILGIKKIYHRVTPQLIDFQVAQSFGEFVQIFKLLTEKNRPKFKYGIKEDS